jgi:hypothetical protein
MAVENLPPDFSTFLDQCLREHIQRQKAFDSLWGIDSCERWEVDQAQGTITFFNTRTGHKKLAGDVQILGTFHGKDKKWLWSWADASVAPELRNDALALREYGAKNLRMRLTEKQWTGEIQDVWKMVALAVKLLGADAVYRGPVGPQDVFMVIRHLHDADSS